MSRRAWTPADDDALLAARDLSAHSLGAGRSVAALVERRRRLRAGLGRCPTCGKQTNAHGTPRDVQPGVVGHEPKDKAHPMLATVNLLDGDGFASVRGLNLLLNDGREVAEAKLTPMQALRIGRALVAASGKLSEIVLFRS